MVVTAGATAVGGGDFTVVVLLLSVVLLDVDSVTMVWAETPAAIANKATDTIIFFIFRSRVG